MKLSDAILIALLILMAAMLAGCGGQPCEEPDCYIGDTRPCIINPTTGHACDNTEGGGWQDKP